MLQIESIGYKDVIIQAACFLIFRITFIINDIKRCDRD